jgi:sec-independent protein translocase protein TatA
VTSMIGFLDAPEAIVVVVIVLVLFGGSQIPKLARNLGRAQKEFKDGIEEASKEASKPAAPSATETSSPTDTTAK